MNKAIISLFAASANVLLFTPSIALNFSADYKMNQLAVINLHETENANLHFDAAFEYDGSMKDLEAHNYQKAASRLEEILNYYPDEPTILTAYGVALEGAGDWARAEKAFAKALRYKKDKVLARAEHGLALAKLGKIAEAQRELAALQDRAAECGLCAESGNIHDGIEEIEAALPSPKDASSSPHP